MSPSAATPAPANRPPVALETTLLLHGVPAAAAPGLAADLFRIIREHGAEPALTGVVDGRPVRGMTEPQLATLLRSGPVPKLNSSNLGIALHRRTHGATTVSATMELAVAEGIRVFATGGIGGVHAGWTDRFDVSTDLVALTRFPVAVVASGVKSILDVAATREALETLGVPVIGFGTDLFPAFYQRSFSPDLRVDARFDDARDLAAYLAKELARTGRGVLVCNPVPAEHEITTAEFLPWLEEATSRLRSAHPPPQPREVTPFLLSALHEISGSRTLFTNIALVKSNAALAGRLAAAMPRGQAAA